MPLSDQQVERYSRQIILPEVGGRGQERLLASCVAIAGRGAIATTAVRYLAGAGIGTMQFTEDGDGELAASVRALNPDVSVMPPDAGAGASVWVAADLAARALDDATGRARARGVPLVAAACRGQQGWVAVDGCASCASRAVQWPLSDPGSAALAPVAETALGALLALAAIAWALGRRPTAPPLRWFDASSGALEPVALPTAAECAGCSPLR